MQPYSKDVNVYVQAKAPLNEKKIPVVLRAIGAINKEAIPLDMDYLETCRRKITEQSLSSEYAEALTNFEKMLVLVFQILNAKGGLTQTEWDLLKSSLTKTKFMFPDIIMELGTRQAWTIERGSEENFIRTLLSKHGFEVKILPEPNGNLLFENATAFIEKMYTDFGINTIFRDIERAIDKRGRDSGYQSTKKKLYYITIYDFMKYHLDITGKPPINELVQALKNCTDRNVGEIIEIRDNLIPKVNGDFWTGYDKFLDFKYLETLVYWFSSSKIRCLSGEAYNYFSSVLHEEMLVKALRYLKVHTASLNMKRIKVQTKGNSANFSCFEIQRCSGDIYATVCTGKYAVNYEDTTKRIKLTQLDQFRIDNLEFGKAYYISLWEVTGKDDAVKLGDLPSVTPGIEWPVSRDLSKSMISDVLHITLKIENPDKTMSYVICMKKGNTFINSFTDGSQFKPSSNSTETEIKFSISNLIYDEEYTFCVYVLLQNGKYFNKICQDFKYTPKKLQLFKVIRKPGLGFNEMSENFKLNTVSLEFGEKHWPQELDNVRIKFACRTDRYPENFDDSEGDFWIASLDQDSYREGMFKIRTNKTFAFLQNIYICGWIDRGSGLVEQVVKNALYQIHYTVKRNEIILNTFCETLPPLPALRFYLFDKKHNLLYSDENVVFNNGKYTGKWSFMNFVSAKYVQLEAKNPEDRLIYEFTGLKK